MQAVQANAENGGPLAAKAAAAKGLVAGAGSRRCGEGPTAGCAQLVEMQRLAGLAAPLARSPLHALPCRALGDIGNVVGAFNQKATLASKDGAVAGKDAAGQVRRPPAPPKS